MARARRSKGATRPGSKIKLRSATTKQYKKALSNPVTTRGARTYPASKPMVGSVTKYRYNRPRVYVNSAGKVSNAPKINFQKFRNG